MTINARLRAAESVTRASQLAPTDACGCAQADCLDCGPVYDDDADGIAAGLRAEVSALRNRLAAIALNVAAFEAENPLSGETCAAVDAFAEIKRLALGLDDATADTERPPT